MSKPRARSLDRGTATSSLGRGLADRRRLPVVQILLHRQAARTAATGMALPRS
jgi:hypothetical protein